MPTARKIKELTIQHVTEEVIQTLKIIKENIQNASNVGEFYTLVHVTEELMKYDICIKFLKDLGYDVTLGIPDPKTKNGLQHQFIGNMLEFFEFFSILKM